MFFPVKDFTEEQRIAGTYPYTSAVRVEIKFYGALQDGRVIAEKWLCEELSGAPGALVDFHTGPGPCA